MEKVSPPPFGFASSSCLRGRKGTMMMRRRRQGVGNPGFVRFSLSKKKDDIRVGIYGFQRDRKRLEILLS